MKRTLTLLFAASVIFFGRLQAQNLPAEPLLRELVGRSGAETLNDLVEHPLGGFAAVGSTSRGLNGGADIYWLSFDPDLRLRGERHIGRRGDDGAWSMAVMPDGRYAVAGFSSKPIRPGKQTERYAGGRDGWLLLLDESGQTLREYLFGGSQDDEFRSVLALPDGGLLLAGRRGSSAWLLCLDPSGQIRWEKQWQYQQQTTHIQSALLSTEGRLFLAGWTGEEGSPDQRIWLSAWTLEGEKILERVLVPDRRAAAWSLAELAGGEIGMAGAYQDPEYRENGFFCRLNARGEIRQFHSLGGRENDHFRDLLPLPEGRVLLLGSGKSFTRGSRRWKIWAAMVDSSGQQLQEQYYGTKTNDEGRSLLFRQDGGLVMAGETGQQILLSLQGWLALVARASRSPAAGEMFSWNLAAPVYQNGLFLAAGERAFLPLTLENKSAEWIWNLSARLEPLNASKELPVIDFKLPVLSRRGIRNLGLPLTAPRDTASGEYRFRLQLYQNGKPLGLPRELSIQYGRPPAPLLSLRALELPGGLRRGQQNKLSIELRNEGNGPARGVVLQGYSPVGPQAPEAKVLGDLQPGQRLQAELDWFIPADYPAAALSLRLRAVDAALNATAAVEWQGILREPEPQTGADSMAGRPFLLPVWVYPNPDHYEGRDIVWPSSEITVQVKVVSSKEVNRQHFCLELNGSPCSSGAKFDEVRLRGERLSRTFIQRVSLREGKNVVRAVVQNEVGKQVTPPLNIVYAPAKPNLHLVTIGVPSVDLKYTAKDARDLAAALLAQSGINGAFQQVFVDTLVTEERTTKTEILKSLRRLQYRFADAQIHPRDLMIVFISSHGMATAEGDFRIAASDYDGPFLEETTLHFEQDIINYLQPIDCVKLFLVDACHSGAGGEKEESLFIQQAPGSALARISPPGKGLNLLVSCQADEYSYEDDQWQNGAFTEALLEVLPTAGRPAAFPDTNGDQQFDLQELFGYLQQRVPELLQQKRPRPQTGQTPNLIRDQAATPIILFARPKKKN